MFNFKNKTNTNAALSFLQKKDIDVAQAYRTRNVAEISKFCSRDAVNAIRRDITRHNTDNSAFGVCLNGTNDKYSNENLLKRTYEVISDDADKCVIKRLVSFKETKLSGIKVKVNDDFAEIFEILKSGNGFVINSVVAA